MNPDRDVQLIFAHDENRVMGKKGIIPWYSPHDFQFFKSTTMGVDIVMGRKTWESLRNPPRPLPGRRNIVVTRNLDYEAPGAVVVHSLEDALALENQSRVFVIGGRALLEEAAPFAEFAYVSHIGVRTPVDDTCVMAPDLPVYRVVAHHTLFEGDATHPGVVVECRMFS